MNASGMELRILLPYEVFLERDSVRKVVAEAPDGLFGVLPNRLDCAAALVPGILSYEADGAGEAFVAVDAGFLLKTGRRIVVSTRNAAAGVELGELRGAVDRLYRAWSEEERASRAALAKLQGHFIRQLTQFRHA